MDAPKGQRAATVGRLGGGNTLEDDEVPDTERCARNCCRCFENAGESVETKLSSVTFRLANASMSALSWFEENILKSRCKAVAESS